MGIFKNGMLNSIEKYSSKGGSFLENLENKTSKTQSFIEAFKAKTKNFKLSNLGNIQLPKFNFDTNVKVDYVSIALIALSVFVVGRFLFTGKRKFFKLNKGKKR